MHDLAGAHYSIETIAKIKENLPFVYNSMSPKNVALTGQIENLWGRLAQKFKEGGWKATTQ